jgi:dihydropteroate synthase
MVGEGADIIDIGGESTRPNAVPVTVEEELQRVIPVVESIVKKQFPVKICVDTSQPRVMKAAIEVGVHMINDTRALQVSGAIDAVANSPVAVCLMHMQGEPPIMQKNHQYDDVVSEVKGFLAQRIEACTAKGVAIERIIVDPGFGFGKTFKHNAHLLNDLSAIVRLGRPVMVGFSRKAMIGYALGLPVNQRLYPSLALAVLAVSRGATIVRTHDVRPTVEAVRMVDFLCH